MSVTLPFSPIGTPAHHIKVLMGALDMTIQAPCLAGRLAYYVRNWEVITQDRWVLHAIVGYKSDLIQTPHQGNRPAVLRHNQIDQTLITEEVQELLTKQAIRESQLSPNSFISQLFLVEKKGGGQRPVVNLKALNNFVRLEHFKMEGLHILPDLIQTGDYMIKLDLKDAYLQIPIHLDHQHLLQFQWMEKTYQFLCLPFGLTSAPRVYTKMLKPLIGTLRQIGIRLVVYLDDILILHQGREELARLICNLFEALGLVINTKKSLLIPQQSTEFLGFPIKSVILQIQMPQEKLKKI